MVTLLAQCTTIYYFNKSMAGFIHAFCGASSNSNSFSQLSSEFALASSFTSLSPKQSSTKLLPQTSDFGAFFGERPFLFLLLFMLSLVCKVFLLSVLVVLSELLLAKSREEVCLVTFFVAISLSYASNSSICCSSVSSTSSAKSSVQSGYIE